MREKIIAAVVAALLAATAVVVTSTTPDVADLPTGAVNVAVGD